MVSPERFLYDIDKGFKPDEINTLINYTLYAPPDVFKAMQDKILDFNAYDKKIGAILQELGRKKATMVTTNKSQKKKIKIE